MGKFSSLKMYWSFIYRFIYVFIDGLKNSSLKSGLLMLLNLKCLVLSSNNLSLLLIGLTCRCYCTPITGCD